MLVKSPDTARACEWSENRRKAGQTSGERERGARRSAEREVEERRAGVADRGLSAMSGYSAAPLTE